MPLWGNVDAANNAPKNKSIATGSSVVGRGNTLFANTTIGAFITHEQIGLFGTSVAEANALGYSLSPGWTLVRKGTGPIVTITPAANTVGYSNSDVVLITSPETGGNAHATISTNSTGGAVVLNISTPGFGFVSVNATANVSITNSTGGTATGNSTVTGFSAVAGGHAGRSFRETLAVVKGMSGNGSSTT
jgi:hypothetical protein